MEEVILQEVVENQAQRVQLPREDLVEARLLARQVLRVAAYRRAPPVERLVALVHRRGSLRGLTSGLAGRPAAMAVAGHYIADAKAPKPAAAATAGGDRGWKRCNDSDVKDIDVAAVCAETAQKCSYILIYTAASPAHIG